MLAIAERLDTLAGGFAAGLKPTGNKDPFALRRNALGLARTIIESGFDLSLPRILGDAICLADEAGARVEKEKGQSVITAIPEKHFPEWAGKFDIRSVEIYDFILDRLRGYYADKGVPATHFNAVAELKPASLYDFDRRINAIGTFAQLPEAEALAAANKRIRNILRKAEGEIPGMIAPALLREPAESELAEAVTAAIDDTNASLHQKDYVAVLARLARLRPQVDAFFDKVMVNADDAALRNNRLALLRTLGDRLGSIAAIEHLSN